MDPSPALVVLPPPRRSLVWASAFIKRHVHVSTCMWHVVTHVEETHAEPGKIFSADLVVGTQRNSTLKTCRNFVENSTDSVTHSLTQWHASYRGREPLRGRGLKKKWKTTSPPIPAQSPYSQDSKTVNNLSVASKLTELEQLKKIPHRCNIPHKCNMLHSWGDVALVRTRHLTH